jgi:hypothetical protein
VGSNVDVVAPTDVITVIGMRRHNTMLHRRRGLSTTANCGIPITTAIILNHNRMDDRGRITTNVVRKTDPFVAPITTTVTTAAVDMYATTHTAKATITSHRGTITTDSDRLLEVIAMRRAAHTTRNTAERQRDGNRTATISRTADTPTNQLHSTDHGDDFMAVVKELVIQQLTSSRMNYAELTQLCTDIQNRLVLNLSSTLLTTDQLSVLQLGIGFRPNFAELSRTTTASEVKAVDCVVQKLALALHACMNRQQYGRETPASRTNTKQEGNPKQPLLASLSGVYTRFRSDLRDDSNDAMSDVDVVSGYHLKQFGKRLLHEFRNADGRAQHNINVGQTTALQHLHRLVKNRQIIIRKADKSRQVCILDPIKYDQAVMAQLSDTKSYMPTEFNLNRKCAALLKRCVRKFVERKLLTNKQAQALLLYTDKPATRHCYGLPKTHKPADKWINGMPPLRPICPDIRTETSASGCFIARYLNPLLSSIKSYCKNSYELKDRLLDLQQLGPETVLLTSDVDSLYPSIPIQPALHRVVRRLNNKAPEFQLVVELLRIQLAHNYFSFQEKSFHQIRGLPMGKAWAPVVACIYMEEWECSLWKLLGFEPVMYVRYIDDIFAVFRCRADAEKFIAAANVHDINIRLSDTSIGRSVHFLDLHISLSTLNRIETSLYRKESDLIVLLHHCSAHQSSIKYGVILSQLRRFLRLHTNYAEAGRCMHTFMWLMVHLRGLRSRRARFLWSTFTGKIRSGAICLGRAPANTANGLQEQENRRRHFGNYVRLPVPPTVRRKRIQLLLNDFLAQLDAQQRAGLRNITVVDTAPPPLGVILFRH